MTVGARTLAAGVAARAFVALTRLSRLRDPDVLYARRARNAALLDDGTVDEEPGVIRREEPMPYSFTLTVTIPASPEEIYQTWLDTVGHSEMTGAKASMSDEVGAEVSAWDGYITGRNLELISGERIVQSWRTSEFSDEHEDSIITVVLQEAGDGALLTLEHSNVPDEQTSYEEDGWQSNYFEPMVAYFSERQGDQEDASPLQPDVAPAPRAKAPPRAAKKAPAKAKGVTKSKPKSKPKSKARAKSKAKPSAKPTAKPRKTAKKTAKKTAARGAKKSATRKPSARTIAKPKAGKLKRRMPR